MKEYDMKTANQENKYKMKYKENLYENGEAMLVNYHL
jgi:hypothetical protein